MASVFSGLPHNLILDIIKTELDRQKSELDTLDYWTSGVGEGSWKERGGFLDLDFCQDLGDLVDLGDVASTGREGSEECRPFWLKSELNGDIRMLGDHNKLVQKGGHYDGEGKLVPQKKLAKEQINRKSDLNYILSITRLVKRTRRITAREVKVNLRKVRDELKVVEL